MIFGLPVKLVFVIIAGILGFVGYVPYFFGITKRETQPHAYTWLIWAITHGIITVGVWYGAGGYPAINTGLGALACVAVFLLSLRYGSKNITKGDTAALLSAFVAVGIWVFLKSPFWSVLVAVVIDLVGYWPSFRKSYVEPWSESAITWFLFGVAMAFSILALETYNFLTLAYYVTCLIANFALFFICVSRRKGIPKPVRAYPDARLVLPDALYKESYLAAFRELQAEGVTTDTAWLKPEENFEGFVEKLKSQARGENLPEGFVAHTEYWLVDGKEYIGGLDIRHMLTDHLRMIGGHIGYSIRPSKRRRGYGKLILKLGLAKAKEMGMEKVLVTCDVSNAGSRKIIEGNGGALEDTVPNPGHPDKARFWIST